MSLPNPPTPLNPPSPNDLTSDQTNLVIGLSALLQTALYYGVLDDGGNLLVPPIDSRYQQMKPESQQAVIDAYRGVFTALIQGLGGISATIQYTKPDTSTGTLIFTCGILTSSS